MQIRMKAIKQRLDCSVDEFGRQTRDEQDQARKDPGDWWAGRNQRDQCDAGE
ncbi:MAG TPA: hypothetical protein VNS11_08380 [Sphingomicrobium sp.]|nr:hypothetical protein [Sphingomicrobium sp.]